MTSDPNLFVPERVRLDVYAILADPALRAAEGERQEALVALVVAAYANGYRAGLEAAAKLCDVTTNTERRAASNFAAKRPRAWIEEAVRDLLSRQARDLGASIRALAAKRDEEGA